MNGNIRLPERVIRLSGIMSLRIEMCSLASWSQTVLPPDLFDRYSKLAFWRDIAKSKVYRIVAQGGEQQATAKPQRQEDHPPARLERPTAR